MSTNLTPDMLISRAVIDSDDQKAGTIVGFEREELKQINIDYIVIELDKKLPFGFKTRVKVRTTDAYLLPDGSIKVKYSKEQLKIMAKEEEIRKHPPVV